VDKQDRNCAAQGYKLIFRSRRLTAKEQRKNDSAGEGVLSCVATELLLSGLLGQAMHLGWEGAAPDLCLDLRADFQVTQPLSPPAPSRRDKEPSGLWVGSQNLKDDGSRAARLPPAHREEDEPAAEKPAEAEVVKEDWHP
jgi:hypothetical protein